MRSHSQIVIDSKWHSDVLQQCQFRRCTRRWSLSSWFSLWLTCSATNNRRCCGSSSTFEPALRTSQWHSCSSAIFLFSQVTYWRSSLPKERGRWMTEKHDLETNWRSRYVICPQPITNLKQEWRFSRGKHWTQQQRNSKLLHLSYHFLKIVFNRFTQCCLSVVLWPEEGDFPENLHSVVYVITINKRSFEKKIGLQPIRYFFFFFFIEETP